MNESRFGERTAKDRWVLPGAAMGVAAGMVFVVFEMAAAAFAGADLLAPLSALGNTVLGRDPFVGLYPPEVWALVGLSVYVIVFAALGALFGASSAVGPARRNRGALLTAGTIFGILLWMLDLALISWGTVPEFPAANLAVQFLAHGVFFGTALALMLGVRVRAEEPGRERATADNGTRTSVSGELRDNRSKGGR